MSANCVYYLIISPKQTQPLNVVDKCLKHFSDLFQRQPKYNDYDILNMFYLNGVCSYLEGQKEELFFVHNNLHANDINCNVVESDEFKNQLSDAKQKFDNDEKIQLIFGDQEFQAHPSIKDVSIIDTNEYDNYFVKVLSM